VNWQNTPSRKKAKELETKGGGVSIEITGPPFMGALISGMLFLLLTEGSAGRVPPSLPIDQSGE
jgi:hypothetical protein